MTPEQFAELKEALIQETNRSLQPKRLFSIEETGHYLGIAPKTIRNGLGPKAAKPFPVKPVKVGGRVVFRRDDLDRFIESLTEGR